ncbi:hypothetical protein NQ318_022537 [Aromia moschata]|uniref:Uncharacterized protein n=1 Tax=Aromia moschata TaxID=1265417 RepID=A0AAV8XN54_9CUCU|nr:hypothetical protein NQ318_022537 [Aromia moschata]
MWVHNGPVRRPKCMGLPAHFSYSFIHGKTKMLTLSVYLNFVAKQTGVSAAPQTSFNSRELVGTDMLVRARHEVCGEKSGTTKKCLEIVVSNIDNCSESSVYENDKDINDESPLQSPSSEVVATESIPDESRASTPTTTNTSNSGTRKRLCPMIWGKPLQCRDLLQLGENGLIKYHLTGHWFGNSAFSYIVDTSGFITKKYDSSIILIYNTGGILFREPLISDFRWQEVSFNEDVWVERRYACCFETLNCSCNGSSFLKSHLESSRNTIWLGLSLYFLRAAPRLSKYCKSCNRLKPIALATLVFRGTRKDSLFLFIKPRVKSPSCEFGVDRKLMAYVVVFRIFEEKKS